MTWWVRKGATEREGSIASTFYPSLDGDTPHGTWRRYQSCTTLLKNDNSIGESEDGISTFRIGFDYFPSSEWNSVCTIPPGRALAPSGSSCPDPSGLPNGAFGVLLFWIETIFTNLSWAVQDRWKTLYILSSSHQLFLRSSLARKPSEFALASIVPDQIFSSCYIYLNNEDIARGS